jgi:hypothetical protein
MKRATIESYGQDPILCVACFLPERWHDVTVDVRGGADIAVPSASMTMRALTP